MTSRDLPPTPARCLHDTALVGAVNMARDQALLECREIPTLRFYRWARPTLSFGYFQSADDLPWRDYFKRGCDVVRRTTGGKAILHAAEQTYSLCVPETGPLAGGPNRAMRVIHDALAEVLTKAADKPIAIRGEQPLLSDRAESAWCFEDSSPLDLTLDSRKVVGSAARRKSGWMLFHGSMVISKPAVTPHVGELGVAPPLTEVASALGQALGYRFSIGRWTPRELEAAAVAELQHESTPWIQRR